jgi:hypothetical protein
MLPESRFTTEPQRSRREFSYDPIGPSPRRNGFGRAGGRRRLDHKLHPFGNKIMSPVKTSEIGRNSCFASTGGFWFGGHLPAKPKLPSLCPLCLCGEKSILDKIGEKG